MITTEIIRDTASFRDLESEWRDLLRASSCNCLFLTWEWMYTWWLHLAGNGKLRIIVVRRDDRLIAIAPLVLRPPCFGRLMPFRVLEFLASGSVGSDYLSFLIRPEYSVEALREITACLTKFNRMLELTEIEKNSLPMANMARQLTQSGWRSTRSSNNYCPYISLSGVTWESYLNSLHASHRLYVNRKLRKLHRDFTVTLQQVESISECQEAMDTFVKWHLQRWSRRGGSTAFNKKALVSFHKAFSQVALREGWLRLYTLSLDQAPAAVLYIFKYNNVHYYYQAAFDECYSKYSVGMIALALAIKNAIADGATEFDLLHGDEDYKYLWTRQQRELIRLEFYPPQILGRIYQQAMAIRTGIKRLLWNFYSREKKS